MTITDVTWLIGISPTTFKCFRIRTILVNHHPLDPPSRFIHLLLIRYFIMSYA